MGFAGVAMTLALALVASLQCAVAVNHTVGGTNGWTVMQDSSFYDNWSKGQKFSVNDYLIFNFDPSRHDVVQVQSHSCSASSVTRTYTESPKAFHLNQTGNFSYKCTFPSHCSLGQLVTVTVIASSNAPSSPPPSSQGPTSSPPPPTTPSSPSPTSTTPSPTSTTPSPPGSASPPPADGFRIAGIPVAFFLAAAFFV